MKLRLEARENTKLRRPWTENICNDDVLKIIIIRKVILTIIKRKLQCMRKDGLVNLPFTRCSEGKRNRIEILEISAIQWQKMDIW